MGKYVLPFLFTVLVDISPFGIHSHPILDELTYKDHLSVEFIGSASLLSPVDGRIKEVQSVSSLFSEKTVITIESLHESELTISLTSMYDDLYVSPDDIVDKGDTIALLKNYTDSSYLLSIKTDFHHTAVDPSSYFPALNYMNFIMVR